STPPPLPPRPAPRRFGEALDELPAPAPAPAGPVTTLDDPVPRTAQRTAHRRTADPAHRGRASPGIPWGTPPEQRATSRRESAGARAGATTSSTSSHLGLASPSTKEPTMAHRARRIRQQSLNPGRFIELGVLVPVGGWVDGGH